MDARTRASRIKLVVFDIDGVMTDGGLHYTNDGGQLKTFNVQDGLGIKLLQQAGFAPANARTIVKERAHLVTDAADGHGAVREAIEFILAARGKLDAAFSPYLAPQ